ncbi:centrosomal protein of 68 kDa isoform X2 [Triplophysa dalaica]|uniref:centrosomal protein of 68 kDa isoform X2 n=1 Tax=Triplophysa dalaica TaxID=1582913 RepID=UPI0024E01C08|nr:centrosomal protein of 68 kDa isoform X2 [Triplophysa dalaica]
MALGVDKALSDTSSQMENTSFGRWKSRIPEFIRSGPREREGSRHACVHKAKDPDKELGGYKKTVTMAPVSRYMTDKNIYTMRKPLVFSTQCLKMPILKNSSTFEDSEKEPHISHKAEYPKAKENSPVKQSFKTFEADSYTFSPQMSREDLDTSMSISDLRHWSSDEEAIFNTSSNEHSLSSPPSAILSLAVPPVPKLISTPLSMSHSSSHTSSYTRSVKTRAVQMDRGKDSLHNTGPFHYHTKNSPHGHMSTNQANYWACAIPNSMPPSPDRRSSSWDPHKEYEALLDYTYPLRPNMANTWSSPESLLRSDSRLQDSGIELDHFYSSSILSGLDPSQVGTRRGRSSPATGRRSTELQDQSLNKLSRSKSSDGVLSRSLYSPLDQTGLSGDKLSLDCDRKLKVHYRSQEDWDEEFLRLPEQIQELNLLSQHLRDISAQMSKPVTTSWESLGSEDTSVSSPTVQMEKQGGGDEEISEDHLKFEDYSEESKETAARLQLVNQEVNRSNLREVEAIMDKLSRISMADLHIDHQDEKEPKESLMQHIQAFCSNLEKLIQWLYKVVEKVEILSPPAIELDSVKASLADYKSFQEEVNAHKPLTADVLQTGEMLLHCMNSASPFLEETLVLIERQSYTLETHSEYLFSSILSAMDSLTDPRSLEVSAGIS